MNYLKKLVILFSIICVAKIILSAIIPSPTMFGDEYVYAKLARSFFLNGEFSVHGELVNYYPPLYPMIISLAYAAKDMQIIYFLMKIINVLISSLIIFPAFYLAKEKLGENNSILAAVLVSVFPANFAFSQFIMSENLFYPLFLASFYFLYKAFKEQKSVWSVPAGILIGLTILTRMMGLLLLVLAAILLAYNIFKKVNLNKNILWVFALPIFIYGLWFLRNIFIFGVVQEGVLGSYGSILRTNLLIPSLLIWLCIYFAYFFLATGSILPLAFFSSKEKNQLWLITAILLVITIVFLAERAAVGGIKAQTLLTWLTGRPFGRYADLAIAPLIICGFVALKQKIYAKSYSILLFSALTMVAASQLVFFSLFPANNISLTAFGIMSYLLEKLNSGMILSSIFFTFVCLTLLFASYFILTKRLFTARKIALFVLLFFLATGTAAYAVNYYNASNYWHNTEQSRLGFWFNDFDKGQSKILFDIRDCSGKEIKDPDLLCSIGNHASMTGFWINNEIIVVDPTINTFNSKYIISKHDLEFEKVKEFSNNIYVYEVT